MTPTTVTPFVSAFIAGYSLLLAVLLTSLVLHTRKGAPERSERSEALPDVLPFGTSGGGPTTS